jgi:phage tail sheath protein FI
MAEYLAPGVFPEETSFRARSIEGVPTDITGFVGPVPSALFTSLADFERAHGQKSDEFSLSVAAFFGNGGQRLHVAPALTDFESIPDISIVAAPGASANPAVAQALIAHCEKLQYRIAVLDSPQGLDLTSIRAHRKLFDSSRAALYYPWVKTVDGLLPPSGFIAGICARTNANKAPAGEPVIGPMSLESTVTKAQQDILNPEGINVLRTLPGRGVLVWGARTLSSNPEWKYVNIRRYFNYLERSIEQGTQWAVFEPNGEPLWSQVRDTISNFLNSEWSNGALLGDRPEKAYFVKCDRTTMTQNDLDNGRLICLIGVAAVKPAEFVIFRIGQWSADRKP